MAADIPQLLDIDKYVPSWREPMTPAEGAIAFKQFTATVSHPQVAPILDLMIDTYPECESRLREMGAKVPEILNHLQFMPDPSQVDYGSLVQDMFNNRKLMASEEYYGAVQPRLVADLTAVMTYRLLQTDVYWYNRVLCEEKGMEKGSWMRKYPKHSDYAHLERIMTPTEVKYHSRKAWNEY